MTLIVFMNCIVLFIGTGLVLFGLYFLFSYMNLRKWHKNKATIVSINESWQEIAISEYTNVKYFFPQIKYKYQIDGEIFYSDRVCKDLKLIWVPEVDSWGGVTSNDMKFWKYWSVGSSINIYIDPNNHDSAVIINKIDAKKLLNYITLIIAGVLMIVAWYILREF